MSLKKSIDTMIDELFAKSDAPNLDIAQLSSTTADAVTKQAPKAQKDDARDAGRPKQISDVPDEDEDGKRAGKYDDDIAKKQAEEENEEGKKQADDNRSDQTMGRQEKDAMVGMPMQKTISAQDYAEYETLKKAKEDKAKEEVLKKAKEEQRDLIKSVILEATASIRKENEELKKSLSKTEELVKAMAERPQRRKSIDGIQALEKSQSEEQGPQNFSKSEMLDVAEELVMKKSMTFRDDHLIELENTGFIYDRAAREALEAELKKRK